MLRTSIAANRAPPVKSTLPSRHLAPLALATWLQRHNCNCKRWTPLGSILLHCTGKADACAAPGDEVGKADDPAECGAVLGDLVHRRVGKQTGHKQVEHAVPEGVIQQQEACDRRIQVPPCSSAKHKRDWADEQQQLIADVLEVLHA